MKLFLTLLALLLNGCAQSGYKQFFSPYVDPRTIPDVELLKEGEEPRIFGSQDFEKDIKTLKAKRYIPIGHSSFNGGYEDVSNAAAQAKRIGATLVLVNSEYTNTQTTTSPLFLPDNRTTYHSGTGSANTTYNNSYGGYLGSSNTNAYYSGTSTTYGTKVVPITTHQRRFDQTAVYLVRSTQKLKYGVAFRELTPDERRSLERNTGVIIDVVLEDTPAFYANVFAGDVLIKIDSILVKNGQHAAEIMSSVSPEAKSSLLTVLRNKEEKTITVVF